MEVHCKMWHQIFLFLFTKVRSGGTKQQKSLLEAQPQLLPVCRGSTKPRVGAGWPRGCVTCPTGSCCPSGHSTAVPGGTGRKPKDLQGHRPSTMSTHSMLILKDTLKEIGLLGQLSFRGMSRYLTGTQGSNPSYSFRLQEKLQSSGIPSICMGQESVPTPNGSNHHHMKRSVWASWRTKR